MRINRTILSVIEVTPEAGPSFFYVDWHPEVTELVNADGKDTDRILEIVEDILATDDVQ